MAEVATHTKTAEAAPLTRPRALSAVDCKQADLRSSGAQVLDAKGI